MSQPPDAEPKVELVPVEHLPAKVEDELAAPDVVIPEVPEERRRTRPTAAMGPAAEPMFDLPAWALWSIVAFAAIYLGNFTMGVDLLPDNLPVVGNLDEVAAFLLGQQAWVALHTGASRLFRLKE